MLNENKYKDFDERAFICDSAFQDWVINKKSDDDRFWEHLFEVYPDKKSAADAARQFLLNINFKEELPLDSTIEALFERHQADIEAHKQSEVIDGRRTFMSNKFLKIAAVFGGVLLAIAALFLTGKKENRVLVQTTFGNLRSIVLPDSSFVVLNGNSSVSFSENWRRNEVREVWLDGEAFFDVRHLNKDIHKINKDERFIVHTKELSIEVLGTSFNIRMRRNKTEVALQSGKIKVSFLNKKKEAVELVPGEKLTYNAEEDKLVKAPTQAENASAWKEKKLLLDDPTVAEVVEYLEDVFGKKIVLANAAVGERKLEGPIQLTNLDDALFVLSTVLNAEIIKKDSTIIIRSR